MNKIAKYLNQHLDGNVFDQASILDAYSTDRSVLRIPPKLVAVPESTNDLRKLTNFVNQLANRNIMLPITVRGSGLDKTGADLGKGLIISTEKLDRILEIDEHARLVRVQAGVTIKQLNSALALYGLCIPVDAHPDQTIGGLIANYSIDTDTLQRKSFSYCVDRLEVVLASGECLQTGDISNFVRKQKQKLPSTEGAIYRKFAELELKYQDLIKDLKAYPSDFAGYRTAVRAFDKNNLDLTPVFFASQGTLGIISEVILRCEIIQPQRCQLGAFFASPGSAIEFMRHAQRLKPRTIDFYDTRILSSAIDCGKKFGQLTPRKSDQYAVFVSFEASKFAFKRIMKKLQKNFKSSKSRLIFENQDNQADFQEIDNILPNFLNNDTSSERISLVDDAYIPESHLLEAIKSLTLLEKTLKSPLPLYGSFLANNYSIRPDIQLSTVSGRERALTLLKRYSRLLADHQGSISGVAPEGRTKGIVTTPYLSIAEIEFYRAIKEIFDPNDILNPEVKLGANLKTTIRHLRTAKNTGIITE